MSNENLREDRQVSVQVKHEGNDYLIPVVIKNFQDVRNRRSKCRGCGVDIAWGITKKEKRMPIEPVSGNWEVALDSKEALWEPHWANCPAHKNFRK